MSEMNLVKELRRRSAALARVDRPTRRALVINAERALANYRQSAR